MSTDLRSLCRTCFSESSSYHPLYDYVEENNILEMLDSLVPQIDIKTSQFSSLVCQICTEKLLIGYKFQQLCIETNNRFHDLADLSVFDTQPNLEIIVDPLTADPSIKIEVKTENACTEIEASTSILDGVTTSKADDILQTGYGSDSNSQPAKPKRPKGYFPCTECKKKFRSLNGLKHHTNTIHDKKQDIQDLPNILKVEGNDGIQNKTQNVVKEIPEILDNDNDFNNSENSTIDEVLSITEPGKIQNVDKGELENSKYSCKLCGREFNRPAILRRHNEAVHSLSRPHECKICKYRFATIKKLKIHLLLHTTHTGNLKCPDCPKTFNSKSTLVYHVQRHAHPNEEINYPPRTKEMKILHCKKLLCKICKKEFLTRRTLKEHHIRMHSDENNYLCQQCGKAFRSASNLSVHMTTHADTKKYQCPECPKRFTCNSYLLKHKKSHSNLKPHVCDNCGSSFATMCNLQKHKKNHSGERPYKCNQCSMTFVVGYSLRRHMRTHTGEKPYKCKFCERAYAEGGDLTKHLRTHVGENTYMCDQCPEAFKFQVELRQHQSMHYKMSQKILQKEQIEITVEHQKINEQIEEEASDSEK